MLYPRFGHSATVLTNGMVFVTGGGFCTSYVFEECLIYHTTEIYHSPTDTWTLASSMHVKRLTHTSSLLTNGNLLVAGGIERIQGDNEYGTNTTEVYYALDSVGVREETRTYILKT